MACMDQCSLRHCGKQNKSFLDLIRLLQDSDQLRKMLIRIHLKVTWQNTLLICNLLAWNCEDETMAEAKHCAFPTSLVFTQKSMFSILVNYQ